MVDKIVKIEETDKITQNEYSLKSKECNIIILSQMIMFMILNGQQKWRIMLKFCYQMIK